MKLHHGTYATETLALHEGLCLTDDQTAARAYARQYVECGDPAATVHTIEIDLGGLTVAELDGTWNEDDPDTFADPMPGTDYPSDIDVLIYTDYARSLAQMTTYRLLTPAALGRVRHIAAEVI